MLHYFFLYEGSLEPLIFKKKKEKDKLLKTQKVHLNQLISQDKIEIKIPYVYFIKH